MLTGWFWLFFVIYMDHERMSEAIVVNFQTI
jgi:hypothetical protein